MKSIFLCSNSWLQHPSSPLTREAVKFKFSLQSGTALEKDVNRWIQSVTGKIIIFSKQSSKAEKSLTAKIYTTLCLSYLSDSEFSNTTASESMKQGSHNSKHLV